MVTSDQGKKITIEEILIFSRRFLPKIYLSSWNHWDRSDSLPIIVTGTMH